MLITIYFHIHLWMRATPTPDETQQCVDQSCVNSQFFNAKWTDEGWKIKAQKTIKEKKERRD